MARSRTRSSTATPPDDLGDVVAMYLNCRRRLLDDKVGADSLEDCRSEAWSITDGILTTTMGGDCQKTNAGATYPLDGAIRRLGPIALARLVVSPGAKYGSTLDFAFSTERERRG